MPQTQTVTFNYTGAEQGWIVPNGVEQITIDCYGAQGGNGKNDKTGGNVPGGKGGRAKANYAVNPGEILYIYVGGQGLRVSKADSYTGGWNGGGRPGLRDTSDGYKYFGSGGGGASDVRRGGQTLDKRIIVAGGGGGSGVVPYEGIFTPDDVMGGNGGGLTGGNAVRITHSGYNVYGGYGGTQTEGGAEGNDRFDGPDDGVFGYGGNAGNGSSADNCGAGGGGWYGGGGGDGYGGGGGGSGYIAPGATNTLFETGVRSGHGLVIITYEIISPMYVRVNGQVRESASIHVRVDGQLREVDRIWTRINGQLREV